MEKNNVSVIIPTYGRPTALKRAVDSVLNQSYQNVEVIVVDDNNPDTDERRLTEESMKGYEGDERVIYLQHEHNKNGSAARNTGLARASGEYVAFLDDDDEMRQNRIELMYNKMQGLDSSWVCCYSGFTKKKRSGEDKCGESREGELYKEALMRSLYFCPGSNMFVRTKTAKEIGGFDEDFKRNQDLEFLARLLEKGKLARIPEDTLIIHYEEKPAGVKPDYERLVSIDSFFLEKFKSRIDALSKKDRKKVYCLFALERFRYSIKTGDTKDSIKNMQKNGVSLWLFIRYLFYMAYRMITKKSVGFNI